MRKEHGTQLFATTNGLDAQMEHDTNLQCRPESVCNFIWIAQIRSCVIYTCTWYAYIRYMDTGSHNPLGKVISQHRVLLALNILHKRLKNNSAF